MAKARATVTLSLSLREAETLSRLFDYLVGGGETRQILEHINAALVEAGVYSNSELTFSGEINVNPTKEP